MSQLKFNLPSPIQKVSGHRLPVDLFVKREDLIHPLIKGNKYRKLKYNLDLMLSADTVITFGGAYSNHLHALAALCANINKPSVGIIRGDEVSNTVLQFCESCGMQLHFVSREDYRLKENGPSIKAIIQTYENALLIPEGGSNDNAMLGVKEIIDETVESGKTFDYIAVAAGTGCTAAGLLQGIHEKNLATKLLVFSALKGDWMKPTIQNFVGNIQVDFFCTDAYALGGYAKSTEEYEKFLHQIRSETKMDIDRVYNGKLLYGLTDMADKGYFRDNEKILWINSGGVTD